MWIAKRLRSQATHLRPSFSATATVVPDPAKKSPTMSSGFELKRIIRSRRASGFCVHTHAFKRLWLHSVDVQPQVLQRNARHFIEVTLLSGDGSGVGLHDTALAVHLFHAFSLSANIELLQETHTADFLWQPRPDQ